MHRQGCHEKHKWSVTLSRTVPWWPGQDPTPKSSKFETGNYVCGRPTILACISLFAIAVSRKLRQNGNGRSKRCRFLLCLLSLSLSLSFSLFLSLSLSLSLSFSLSLSRSLAMDQQRPSVTSKMEQRSIRSIDMLLLYHWVFSPLMQQRNPQFSD
jgi:hypothetical protein